MRTLAAHIAGLVDARARCARNGNREWHGKHTDALGEARKALPSGAGIDNGTTIDLDASTPERLVFHTSFHHMDEHGGYDGWTNHSVMVTPSLINGILVDMDGPDRNDILLYLSEVFWLALTAEVP